jgi:hypothetical protein
MCGCGVVTCGSDVENGIGTIKDGYNEKLAVGTSGTAAKDNGGN